MKLPGVGRGTGGHGPFEIVENGQQFMDERFFLRSRTDLALLATAALEIIEVGSQTQVLVLLFREFRAEQLGFSGSGVGEGYIGFRFVWKRVLEFAVHEVNANLQLT